MIARRLRMAAMLGLVVAGARAVHAADGLPDPVPQAVRASRERDAIRALEAEQERNRGETARIRKERAAAFNEVRMAALDREEATGRSECRDLSARIARLDADGRARAAPRKEAEARSDADEAEALGIESAGLRRAKEAAERDLLERMKVLAREAGPAGAAAAARVESLDASLVRLQEEWGVRRREIGERTRALEVRSPEPKNAVYIDLSLPPCPDAAARARRFADRNSPAELAVLATNFFRIIDPSARGVGPAVAHFRAGRPAEALDAYRDHFFEKVRHPGRFGIPAGAFTDDEHEFMSPRRPPPAWIAGATQGIAHVTSHDLGDEFVMRARVGPPGAVHWGFVADEPAVKRGKPVWLEFQRRFGRAIGNDGGAEGLRDVLMDAYAMTGDAALLRRWAEYADDWAMNWPAAAAASTNNLRYYDPIIPRLVCGWVSRMRATAIERPAIARDMSAPTLARMLIRLQEEYLAPNILVARTTRQNWNMMGLGFNARNELLLPEFLPAQWAGREARRGFESAFVFTIMPDGGSVEYVDEGHQGVWRERTAGALRLWRQAPPPWFTPAWEAELLETFNRNVRFWVRHVKADGYQHRDGFRNAREVYVGGVDGVFGPQSLDTQAPWVVGEPEVKRVLGTVFGRGEHGAPRHVSDVMPDLGEFLMRGSWDRDAPFFYMHAGRTPNSNPAEDATAFSVHAFGRHLFYGSPVYVDGRSQNAHFGMVDNPGSKTAYLSYSDGRPSIGRWHTSARFDVAEGFYEGAYENREGRAYLSPFKAGGNTMSVRQVGAPPVTDVRRHARQVIFVREPVLWIVVDRIATGSAHRYEIPYEFYTPVTRLDWLRRARTPIPDADRRVVIDGAGQSVATHNPGWPNVTLRHFASAPLRYEFDPKSPGLDRKSKGDAAAAQSEWRLNRPELQDVMAFSRRVLASWEGRGDQTVVTLIEPRAPGAAPSGMMSASMKSDTVASAGGNDGRAGFEGALAGGGRVRFAAGPPAGRAVDWGVAAAEAEALLLLELPDRPVAGVVLGARSLRVGGRAVELSATDAEFVCGPDGAVRLEPFHRPIEPVEFDPPVNAFIGSIDVAMRCATPGVEIRYTLDGSDPTPTSPRYDRPVRLAETARIKASAMRPGLAEVPWELRPGHASLPTWAVFTRQEPLPAVPAADATAGLRWEYLEGPQFALVSHSALAPATRTGATTNLMDVSMRATDGAFGVRYRGLLEVPADGVYTFHAPREFVMPDVEAGYDLRVFVQGREWDPATRRHAMGAWSVALAKGAHPFDVIFVDTRSRPFKYETWRDWPNPAVLWKGTAPVLEVSGPGVPRQPVPAAWFRRSSAP